MGGQHRGYWLYLPFLLQLVLCTNKFLLGCHLSPRVHCLHTTEARQPLPLPPYSLKDHKTSSKCLTDFRASPYSHEWTPLPSRNATAYHTDNDGHPGIPPTDTPDPDGSALVKSLTTHSKNHAIAVLAHRHKNTHHTGDDNCIGTSSVGTPTSGFSASVMCLAILIQDQTLTPPQLIFGPIRSLFRCQLWFLLH